MKLLIVVAPLVTLAVLALPLSPAIATPGPGCLPTPLPSGPESNPSFIMEAAILEPALGLTLSRHNVILHLMP